MHVARSEFVLGTCLGALAGEAPGGGSSDARVTTVVQIKQRAALAHLSKHLTPHLLTHSRHSGTHVNLVKARKHTIT